MASTAGGPCVRHMQHCVRLLPDTPLTAHVPPAHQPAHTLTSAAGDTIAQQYCCSLVWSNLATLSATANLPAKHCHVGACRQADVLFAGTALESRCNLQEN